MDIEYKVFPKVIEDKLEKINGVKSVAINGRKKENVENEMVAFVVKNDSYNGDELISELRNSAINCLEIWEQPEEYHIIDEMPRLASGKVDYRRLETFL